MVLGELVTAAEAVGKLLDKPLRASLAFRIGKLSKEMAPHMETFEKVRQELLEKYGEKVESEESEQGQISYTFKNGGAEKFSLELQEMLDRADSTGKSAVTMDDFYNIMTKKTFA